MAINDMLSMNKEMKSPQMKELTVAITEVENEEEGLLSDMAPKGEWSPEAMNSFLSSLNKVAALFSLPATPEVKAEVTVLPTPVVKVLLMVKSAVDDAIKEEVVSPDLAFDISQVTNDNTLGLLAGKLDLLHRDGNFKRFLKEKPPKGEEVMSEPEDETSSAPEDMDSFLASRV